MKLCVAQVFAPLQCLPLDLHCLLLESAKYTYVSFIITHRLNKIPRLAVILPGSVSISFAHPAKLLKLLIRLSLLTLGK